MKMIVTHTNFDKQEWFFSTDHCQETNEGFVPCTHYNKTVEEIRDMENSVYGNEIVNPDPAFIPEYAKGN